MPRQSGNTARVIHLHQHAAEPDWSNPAERRRAPRRRVLKAAIAAHNNRHCTVRCTLRDISATGARLRSEHAQSIPDTFELIVELDGLVAHCEVIWRKDKDLGVRFLGAPHKEEPRRQQVVEPTAHGRSPSLRRRPKADGA